ncbi:pathogenesis-related thaumatin-like protein 3.3 [Phragmites australis]|uniref:pathogenesis-related thaumatin-like protein 3.3 n=1 Tax=Phragmites australis TaxID=29695 RepID=UPI002D769055|nr:pathogenesis-related thaumatin-like protein 3.3 [Phragmites australis]
MAPVPCVALSEKLVVAAPAWGFWGGDVESAPVPILVESALWLWTGCTFDGSRRGTCDCGGGGWPSTRSGARTTYIHISLVDGFFQCSGKGPHLRGAADVNAQCPAELKVPGSCDSACQKLSGDTYCRRTTPSSSRGCAQTPTANVSRDKEE